MKSLLKEAHWFKSPEASKNKNIIKIMDGEVFQLVFSRHDSTFIQKKKKKAAKIRGEKCSTH